MKKICYITTVSATLKAFVLKSAEYIHENTDWDITFICDNDEGFKESLPEYIHYLPVRMKRGISFGGIKAMFMLLKIFKEERFDLIQYSTPNASLYASLAGRMSGIPIRLYCQWGLAYVGFCGLKRKVFKTIEKLVCSLSTHIEPDSKSNLLFSHEEGLYPKSKGTVIWNGSACGVDFDKFDISKKERHREKIRDRYKIHKDSFVFGYVGRITRDKGINELIAAFKESFTGNEFLVFVGPNEFDLTIDAGLEEWARNNENVIFTGYVNEVEQYLSAMDCFILPSYREGFGMGVVEAEAMGVPVIVTNIPGPVDAIKKDYSGVVVEKKDVQELVGAMQKMKMSDLSYYGKNGVDFVRNSFEQKQLFKHIIEDRKNLLGEC